MADFTPAYLVQKEKKLSKEEKKKVADSGLIAGKSEAIKRIGAGAGAGAGTNKNQKIDSARARKLDEDEHPEIKTVGLGFGKALMQARVAKSLTQEQLAMRVNVSLSVIKGYENGTEIPVQKTINALQKVLGVTLPRTSQRAR